MTARYFRVPLEQIGFVRAILEGYDGLATLSTPDAARGEIAWHIATGREDEAGALASRLAAEAGLVEISRPADWEL